MCAYAISLARVSVVVSGTRPADTSTGINGHTVLSDASMLPSHPVPLVIRDVLEPEYRVLFVER
jgi:hypothetical protein